MNSLLQRYQNDRRKLMEFLMSSGLVTELRSPSGSSACLSPADLDALSADYVLDCVKSGGVVDVSKGMKSFVFEPDENKNPFWDAHSDARPRGDVSCEATIINETPRTNGCLMVQANGVMKHQMANGRPGNAAKAAKPKAKPAEVTKNAKPADDEEDDSDSERMDDEDDSDDDEEIEEEEKTPTPKKPESSNKRSNEGQARCYTYWLIFMAGRSTQGTHLTLTTRPSTLLLSEVVSSQLSLCSLYETFGFSHLF